MAYQEDRGKIPYPLFEKKNDNEGKPLKQSETGQAWDSAKKNFFGGISAALPWGERAQDDKGNLVVDKDGNPVPRVLGFINKMLMAAVDLALAAAWSVVEYVIPAVINTLSWPVRKMDEMINKKSSLETQDLENIKKAKTEKEVEEAKEAMKKAALEATNAAKKEKSKTSGGDANGVVGNPGSVVIDPSAEQLAPAKQKVTTHAAKVLARKEEAARRATKGNQI